jgi:hypothetical protein
MLSDMNVFEISTIQEEETEVALIGYSGSGQRSTVSLANAFVERLIGTIRRECLDHVIVWNETGLGRVPKLYFEYSERTRTHLPFDKDAPIPRRAQPPELGMVVELPEVGGLPHR